MSNAQEMGVTLALNAWNLNITNANKLFDTFSEEQWQRQIAPGKNRGIYLLGHLVAVHDRMLPLLSLGERLYPHLDDIYLFKADRAAPDSLTADELKLAWKNVNATLAQGFAALSGAEWLGRHNSITEEEFIKEPHRNKLSVLMNRTHHMAYHLGQMALLKK